MEKSPLEVIERMRLGVSYRQEISIRTQKFMVRPLSIGETVELANETHEELLKAPEPMRTALNTDAMLARKTLVRAMTSDVGAKDSPLAETILDRFTPEEVQFLYDQYVDVVKSCNPALEEMTEEELGKMVAEVKKSPSELIGLSRWQLLNLVSYFLTSGA